MEIFKMEIKLEIKMELFRIKMETFVIFNKI